MNKELKKLLEAVKDFNWTVTQESEAYLWLDSDGHGINGAPYDMKDLYEDFEACESAIYDLCEYLRDLED